MSNLKCLLALGLMLAAPAARATEDFDRVLLFKLIPKGLISYFYRAPDVESLPEDKMGEEIRYGRELFARTAYYIGPKGSVGQYTGNHMNCQNCHLDAGTRLFGGSLATTHGRYPEYRAREDIIISLADRINLCITRPHIGRPLPQDSREMRAMLIYMKWLGTDTPLNERKFGDEIMDPPLIGRAASPEKGQLVYEKHCQSCHGQDGQGVRTEDGIGYVYPALWGPDSLRHRLEHASGA